MAKQTEKDIATMCDELLKICEGTQYPYKTHKQMLVLLLHALSRAKFKQEQDVLAVLALHKTLCGIKNEKATYAEDHIAMDVLPDIPSSVLKGHDIEQVETLEPNTQPERSTAWNINAALLRHALDIISGGTDKSKRSKNRLNSALELLNRLQDYYYIEGVKSIFFSFVDNEDAGIQIIALDSLEVYYEYEHSIALSPEEIERLEAIIEKTTDRSVASTCCQIMINAGHISEFGALDIMDEWKARNMGFDLDDDDDEYWEDEDDDF